MAEHAGRGREQGAASEERRSYDSPVRRERARETRDRIVASGCALARGFPTWDWRGLTAAAVADHAGVNKTTVYRHFPTERDLHDAIMRRLEDEAGISLDTLDLTNFRETVERSLADLASFAARAEGQEPGTPTLDADRRRRDALLRVVRPVTADWSDDRRQMVAAVLDVVWGTPSHRRLTEVWGLDADQATSAILWAVDALLRAAAETAGPPPHPSRGPSRGPSRE